MSLRPSSSQPTPSPLKPGFTVRQVGLILALFLVSRLLVAAAALLFWHHLPHSPVKPGDPGLPPANRFVDLFRRADANHYTTLIEHGYYHQQDPLTGKLSSNTGFYPLYPAAAALVRALSAITDAVVAGHLVSNACLLGAVFLLWRLAELELGSWAGAGWTVAFALFSPGGAWLSMVFTESLFLLTLVAYLLAIRRGLWGWAAVAGVALALTRTVGILAVAFAAWEVGREGWLRVRVRIPPRVVFSPAGGLMRALALGAPVLGYLALKVYFWRQFGDWQAQHHALEANWPENAHFSWPWTAILREWAPMHASKRLIIYGLLAAALALLTFTRRATSRWSYTILGTVMIGICLTNANHSPMARYLSVVVPLHLTLGWLALRLHVAVTTGLLVISAAAMALITGLMVNGYVFY